MPADPAARSAALADAVFAAVLALQAQLAHPDAAVVRAAAGMILDFEKTRLRHDRPVTGTHEPYPMLEPLGELEPLPDQQVFAATERSGTPYPAPGGRGEDWDDDPDDADNEIEPSEEAVERMRARLQQRADARGSGEQVSWERARRAARQAMEHVRRQASG